MHSTEARDRGPLPESLRDPDRVEQHAASAESIEYFVFRLRGRTYALPPEVIEMVVPEQRVVVVPTAPPCVRGVIYLRGRVIAVIDLPALLGIDDHGGAQDGDRFVVLATECPMVFAVDATLGIWTFAGDSQTRTTDDGPIARGLIADRGGAATVIDPSAIFDRIRTMRTERQ